MDTPAGYTLLEQRAREWLTTAQGLLEAREWIPTEAERDIAWDIHYVVSATTRTSEPTSAQTEPLPHQLRRLAAWAPALRLAARATTGSPETPAPENTFSFKLLLLALYPAAKAAEQWLNDYEQSIPSPIGQLSQEEYDAAESTFMANHPGFASEQAQAEELFTLITDTVVDVADAEQYSRVARRFIQDATPNML